MGVAYLRVCGLIGVVISTGVCAMGDFRVCFDGCGVLSGCVFKGVISPWDWRMSL